MMVSFDSGYLEFVGIDIFFEKAPKEVEQGLMWSESETNFSAEMDVTDTTPLLF